MIRRSLLLLALFSVVGCHTGTLPDPNDPADKKIEPEILQRNLGAISDALIERRLKREIDNDKYKELLSKAASELVDEVDIENIDPAEAWRYGEVLRAARDWDTAALVLGMAVEYAKTNHNNDRFVNDTLRLAQVQAQQGKIELALDTTRTVLNARPGDSAPILMATLYEILPVVKGKKHDLELAELLQQAIYKHETTAVDQSTKPGQDFIAARPYHVQQAYLMLSSLYEQNGKHELANRAQDKGLRARENFSAVRAEDLPDARRAFPRVGQ